MMPKALSSRASESDWRDNSATNDDHSTVYEAFLRTKRSLANLWHWQRPGPDEEDYHAQCTGGDVVNDNAEDDILQDTNVDVIDDNDSVSTIRPSVENANSIQNTPPEVIRQLDEAISPLDLDDTHEIEDILSVGNDTHALDAPQSATLRRTGRFVREEGVHVRQGAVKQNSDIVGLDATVTFRPSVLRFSSNEVSRISDEDIHDDVSDRESIVTVMMASDAPPNVPPETNVPTYDAASSFYSSEADVDRVSVDSSHPLQRVISPRDTPPDVTKRGFGHSFSTGDLHQTHDAPGKRGSEIWKSLLHPRASFNDIFDRRRDLNAAVDDVSHPGAEHGEAGASPRQTPADIPHREDDEHTARRNRSVRFEDLETSPCSGAIRDGVSSPSDDEEAGSEETTKRAVFAKRGSVWTLFRKRESMVDLRHDSTQNTKTLQARKKSKRPSVLSLHDKEAGSEETPKRAVFAQRGSVWTLFRKRESTVDLRHDSTQNTEPQQARPRKKRSSILNLHDVCVRWGPDRWQKKSSRKEEDDANPVSPTADATGRSAGDFIREYVPCMDPYGYAAAIASDQQRLFEDWDDDAEDARAAQQGLRSGETAASMRSDSASVMSWWSGERKEDVRKFMVAAADPDGFSAYEDDE